MKVLIVDDEVAIAEMICVVLDEAGYDTLLAKDGQHALDLAREKRPDVILMDIDLPVLDGATATRRLKRDSGDDDYFIIAMSAVVNLRAEQADLPADALLQKPFDIARLLDLVADAADHAYQR